MPFPADEQIMKTAQGLVDQLQALFGKYPGIRPAHAKGVLLTGTFTPTAEAATLSTAKHFTSPSTPVTVRFSNSTGLPTIPDNDANADPRGIAIRFNLGLDSAGRRSHTDIVAHSVPFFPMSTGAGFLAMLQAVGETGAYSGPSPNPIEQFVGSNPSALAFVTAPKPPPVSYATDPYYAVSAFKLIAADGKATYIRYSILPDAGIQTLSAEEAAGKDANYLQTGLAESIAAGPIGFKITAQIAEDDDVTDDATVHWPTDRKVVELGSFKLDAIEEDQAAKSKHIIFDPIPRVQGVEPSADPLLEMRAAIYLLSGQARRAA